MPKILIELSVVIGTKRRKSLLKPAKELEDIWFGKQNERSHNSNDAMAGFYCSFCHLFDGLCSPQVKYGVKSPKFIWAPCALLYSLADTPQTPPLPRHPPAFGLKNEGAIGQPRQTTSLCDPLLLTLRYFLFPFFHQLPSTAAVLQFFFSLITKRIFILSLPTLGHPFLTYSCRLMAVFATRFILKIIASQLPSRNICQSLFNTVQVFHLFLYRNDNYETGAFFVFLSNGACYKTDLLHDAKAVKVQRYYVIMRIKKCPQKVL